MSTTPNNIGPNNNTGPNTGHRWALSPIDSRNHLLAELDSAPVGTLVADCRQLLPCSVDTRPHPHPGLRCPSCTAGVGQALPVTGSDSATDLSPELVASLALEGMTVQSRAETSGQTKWITWIVRAMGMTAPGATTDTSKAMPGKPTPSSGTASKSVAA